MKTSVMTPPPRQRRRVTKSWLAPKIPQLNTFSPAAIVFRLQLNRDRAVFVHWLFTCPRNGFLHSWTNFQLCRQIDFAQIALRQDERALSQGRSVGMTRVKCAFHTNGLIRALNPQPKYTRNSCHAAIRNANHKFIGAISLSLPYPGWPQAIAQLGSQTFKSARIFFVVACKIVGFRPQSPIIRLRIERVQHVILEFIDAR